MSTSQEAAQGWVALVGAGPGDEGLLTVRAAELLGQAGLVVAGAIPRIPVASLVVAGAVSGAVAGLVVAGAAARTVGAGRVTGVALARRLRDAPSPVLCEGLRGAEWRRGRHRRDGGWRVSPSSGGQREYERACDQHQGDGSNRCRFPLHASQ